MSCKKEPNTSVDACTNYINMPIYLAGDTTHGTIHAYRNGETWIASGWARRYPTNKNFLGLVGYTFAMYGEPREHFHISAISLKEGRFFIKGNAESTQAFDGVYSYLTTTADDGDVAEDSYQLVYEPESWVEITHLDTINNKVAGKFEVYLAVEQPKECLQNLDNLCFRSGTFELDIIE